MAAKLPSGPAHRGARLGWMASTGRSFLNPWSMRFESRGLRLREGAGRPNRTGSRWCGFANPDNPRHLIGVEYRRVKTGLMVCRFCTKPTGFSAIMPRTHSVRTALKAPLAPRRTVLRDVAVGPSRQPSTARATGCGSCWSSGLVCVGPAGLLRRLFFFFIWWEWGVGVGYTTGVIHPEALYVPCDAG